jgi:hypothetical protein
MACFDNVISYKNGCEASSGLLLDNLVQYGEVSKYVTEDYEDASELIDEKIQFAVKNVVEEMSGHFASQYIPKTLLENKRAGFFDETQTENAAAANTRKGIELEICNRESFYQLYVSFIETYLNYTGSVSVLVIDTMTGETLDTITVTSVAGEIVQTYVDKTYTAEKRKRRIAFVYDATGIPNYATTLIGEGCTTCSKGLYNLSGFITGRSISVPTASDPILANIDSANDTAGLSINFSLSCDNQNWLCSQRNLLGMPILYRTAELIMEFSIFNTDRFNSKTAINKKENEERMMKYHEDYEKQMSMTLKNISAPSDGVCFTCRKTRKSVTSLP